MARRSDAARYAALLVWIHVFTLAPGAELPEIRDVAAAAARPPTLPNLVYLPSSVVFKNGGTASFAPGTIVLASSAGDHRQKHTAREYRKLYRDGVRSAKRPRIASRLRIVFPHLDQLVPHALLPVFDIFGFTSALGATSQVVAPGASIDSLWAQYPDGVNFILQPGGQTLSMSALASSSINPNSSMVVGGAAQGGISGWLAGNVTTDTDANWTITVTGFQTAANQVAFTGVEFANVAFTSSATGVPLGHVCFWGRSTTDLTFHDIGIFDMQACFLRGTGPQLQFFNRLAVGQTGGVPTLSQSILTCQDIFVQDFVGNFAGNTGMFGVNAANTDSTSFSYTRWTFMSMRWAGSGVENMIDSEFSPASSGPQIYVGYAYLTDIEMGALVNVESFTVDTVYQQVTSARGSTCPLFRTFVTAGTAGFNPGFGILEVGTAVVSQQDTAANGTAGAAVLTITGSSTGSENAFYAKRIHFQSLTTYLNGKAISAGGASPPISLAINTTGTANATVVDDFSIDKYEFGFTSVPTSPHPIATVNCTGDGSHTYTFGNIQWGTVIALGTTAASAGGNFPATVNGGVITQLMKLGIAAQVNAATIGWNSVDLSRISPTSAAPSIFNTTLGTFTLTAVNAGALVVGDANQTFTFTTPGPTVYTHGTSNLSGGAPAQGRMMISIRGGTITAVLWNGVSVAVAAEASQTYGPLQFGDTISVTSSVSPTANFFAAR